MAIDLTVSLTDQEQAMIQDLALRVAPGATAPQIKAWAERECKIGLRNAVIEKWREAGQTDSAIALTQREAQAVTDFPKVP
jgi:hypothetical protein